MKKILLLAAIAASMTASAQVTWNLESDLKGSTTEANKYTISDAELGTGLTNGGIDQYTYKDADGANQNYPWKSLKAVPVNAQAPADEGHTSAYTEDKYRNISGAIDNGMFMNFTAETVEMEDVLKISSIEFDATRVGTDGVRVNVRIIGNDESYTSDWLITGDNVADGGKWQQKDAEGSAWQTTIDAGFEPCRNDASKADTSAKCYTHFTVPAPTDVPEDLYQATVQIAIYGVSNNKSAYIHGVKLNCSIPSAVAGIAEAKAEAAAPVKVITANGVQIGNYNIAGQQVK